MWTGVEEDRRAIVGPEQTLAFRWSENPVTWTHLNGIRFLERYAELVCRQDCSYDWAGDPTDTQTIWRRNETL